MPVTILDIAKACGTSTTTVSKVLTGNDDRISAEKRQMIHEAMRRLNYRPSMVARALSTKRSNSIGFVTSRVWHMVSRPYYGSLLDAVLDASTALGQRVTLYNTLIPNGSEVDPLMFSDGSCDGLVMLGAQDSGTLSAVAKSGLPCVVINGGYPAQAAVSIQIDNELAAYQATRYLIELGHEKIGYLHMKGILCSDERLAGHRKALAEADISNNDDFVFSFDYDTTAAYRCAKEIAAHPELGLTALFCVSDEIALDAMQGFRDTGVRIPADLSIIGLDGVIEGERSFPRLTTVSQSLKELGAEAVNRLMTVIKTPNVEPQSITWPTRLVIRDTVAAYPLPAAGLSSLDAMLPPASARG